MTRTFAVRAFAIAAVALGFQLGASAAFAQVPTCDSLEQRFGPTIDYDLLPVTSAPTTAVGWWNASAPVKAETVAAGGFWTQALSITARSIPTFGNFSAGSIYLNAQSVPQFTGFSANEGLVIARNIGPMQNFSVGKLCVNAQNIDSLSSASGSFRLISRGENFRRSRLNSITNMNAQIFTRAFDVGRIDGTYVNATFENTTVDTVTANNGGVIVLRDSTIVNSDFRGTVYCEGVGRIVNRLSAYASRCTYR